MTTWQQEAVGIEPWPYCRLAWIGPGRVPTGVTLVWGVAYFHPDDMKNIVVDLSDPDTLAAFDRRLALRLGAPEEMVREGVRFYWEPGGQEWNVEAGYYRSWWTAWAWSPGCAGSTGDAALLARVRAWKSIP